MWLSLCHYCGVASSLTISYAYLITSRLLFPPTLSHLLLAPPPLLPNLSLSQMLKFWFSLIRGVPVTTGLALAVVTKRDATEGNDSFIFFVCSKEIIDSKGSSWICAQLWMAPFLCRSSTASQSCWEFMFTWLWIVEKMAFCSWLPVICKCQGVWRQFLATWCF